MLGIDADPSHPASSSIRTRSMPAARPRSTGSCPRPTASWSRCRCPRTAARTARCTSSMPTAASRSAKWCRACSTRRAAAAWPGAPTARASGTRAIRARSAPRPTATSIRPCTSTSSARIPRRDAYVLGKGLPKIAEIALDNRQNARYVLATVQNGDGGEFAHYLMRSRRPRHAGHPIHRRGGGGDRRAGRQALSHLAAGRAARQAARNAGECAGAGARRDCWCLKPTPSCRPATAPLVVTAQAIYRARDRRRPVDASRSSITTASAAASCRCRTWRPSDEVESVGDGTLLYSVETYLRPRIIPRYREAHGQVGGDCAGPDQPGRISPTSKWCASSPPRRTARKVPLNIMRRKRHGARRHQPSAALRLRRLRRQRSRPTSWAPTAGCGSTPAASSSSPTCAAAAKYGEDWHSPGQADAQAERLRRFRGRGPTISIEQQYTAPEQLAIMGGSNGGLLMGAALTQHPELFRAVVSHVGIYDMLRVELDPNGAFNITEFGTRARTRRSSARSTPIRPITTSSTARLPGDPDD